MVQHVCKRCNYKSINRSDLVRHLKRAIVCKVTLEDIAPSILLDELKPDKSTRCSKCSQNFGLRANMIRHERACTSTLNAMIGDFEARIAAFESAEAQALERTDVAPVVNQPTNSINQTTNHIKVVIHVN